MSVARPLPHDAAPLHVTGAARYVDDIPTPAGTLHLAFGTSAVAAGRILSMDLDAVRHAPGVVAVLTHADLPRDCDVSPAAHDEPLLADGVVHYVGQAVFLVIAESHLAARHAARLGRVEIEAGTPILTIDEALEAGSHFEGGPITWSRGDTEAALAGAPRRISGVMEIGGQEHFYLEGQAALAFPQEGGDMVVHSSSQHPTEIQHKVAHALGIPMHGVRVEVRRMGGGFGGKESQGNALAVACAVAARLTGRACKMRYDRDDDMVITGKRHDFRIAYDVGFDDEGQILGIEFTQYARCGWSQDLSLPVADRAMLHSDNAYRIPAMRIASHRLKTNTQSATAFRGFGGPQGMLGIERVMDHLAHETGLDGAEIRRRNFYAEAEAETKVGTGPGHGHKFGAAHSPKARYSERENITHYGMEVTDFILGGLTDQLLASSDYAVRRAAVEDWNAHNSILKRGIAYAPVKFGISFTLTHLNQAGALVHVYQDGSIHLNHGGTEMGQGLFQKVAQVAASRFGVDPALVRITATDTGKVPNTSATAASSGSDLNGMAAKAACDTIRDRMAECLAELHQARVEEVVFANGEVRIGTTTLPFAEAVQLCYFNRVSLSATGFYKTPDISWNRVAGRGRPFFYFAYGAAVTEVVIDTLTGENRILRADIVHDAGASLNPALDIGQVEGAYVQGAGWLTTEELVWDDAGRLRTHAPSTYKIPACSDRPDIFNVALWDGPNRAETIYRSKAVGEPPLMLGISAFLALSDACAACGSGYPDLDAPATPERVLAAVTRARQA
ncbi:xanthine dehydrogenase molybdopterin binding subunit [Ponticoccus sp. SC2-23]|uniref:xanthine dehydrogenase molybdopterin binding subunit n=1 Tax=Alexandriicola marinus TaxID=2081710 RepID=UPI000FD6DD0F|nr:xanthine dehydrogenase molybdopterin binding subunit [Alexandriicola marinus]MBM1220115.1 xanthine dehydrogenase molybdopterin binding subunit [Ponticoccus sp. SC6-9]MBM1224801.1 xanthine dehydrogenase molybdopterin binding subunit [Ponticoccus sp. SC6-15]MBM1228314.1 xanthine dehydrogenase molybdopterin binding subunit [Ponticoccus sp. SC6-38]MBM1234048.1 xanthine dehydrogenase molybdopterin binding subunit [Ponticoccus sp. SC6-45]MBM1238816.1 xanthine dehydrogenase molybdopterin binding s